MGKNGEPIFYGFEVVPTLTFYDGPNGGRDLARISAAREKVRQRPFKKRGGKVGTLLGAKFAEIYGGAAPAAEISRKFRGLEIISERIHNPNKIAARLTTDLLILLLVLLYVRTGFGVDFVASKGREL